MSAESAPLLILPGFLGTSEEFGAWFLNGEGGKDASPLFIQSVSEKAVDTLPANWPDWANQTIQRLKEEAPGRRWRAVGYSLGGRLLLSLALRDPSLFESLAFISTNSGLGDIAEKKQRLLHDEAWAQRFLSEDWAVLMRDWNSQPVFAGSLQEPERIEKDYDRQRLAQVLRIFSLGLQDFQVKDILGLDVPQLWMAGALDKKYSQFVHEIGAKVLQNEKGTIQVEIVPSASHRLYLDQPAASCARVEEFFRVSSPCSKN